MTTTHRILEDFYDHSYVLLALHSSLEDHAVAYALNKYLKTGFQRSREDLDFSDRIRFPIFTWDDKLNERSWTLIANRCSLENLEAANDLFKDESFFSSHYVVPEFKDVDYLIKIECGVEDIEEAIVKGIKEIPGIMAVYATDPNTLKSRKNLIF